MSDVPTLMEELDRKTLEELERIAHGWDTKRLLPTEVKASVQTLWQLVAGLVPKETMELIAQMPVPVTSAIHNHAVLGDGKTVAYVVRSGCELVIQLHGATMKVIRKPAYENEEQAVLGMLKIISGLRAKGFARLNPLEQQ